MIFKSHCEQRSDEANQCLLRSTIIEVAHLLIHNPMYHNWCDRDLIKHLYEHKYADVLGFTQKHGRN
jgi:hypothetical protein